MGPGQTPIVNHASQEAQCNTIAIAEHMLASNGAEAVTANAVKEVPPRPNEGQWPPKELLQQKKTFLCVLESPKPDIYCPKVVNGIVLQDTTTKDVVLALWACLLACAKPVVCRHQSSKIDHSWPTNKCRLP